MNRNQFNISIPNYVHVHIAKCCLILAGHSNICGKPSTTSHHHNYTMNRIIVVRYTFYGCCTYMDHTARYLPVPILKNEHSVVFFLPIIATFGVAHSRIERKLLLFYYYVVLCMNAENRWFKEKWVLMYLHFAWDILVAKSEHRKKSKYIFSNVVANFNLSFYLLYIYIYMDP